MFIPIFTISPLIFIVGFMLFSKVQKRDEPHTRAELRVEQHLVGLDFELLFFTSSIDSALILQEKGEAPSVDRARKAKTLAAGERTGIWS